jgi:hypothetical protein
LTILYGRFSRFSGFGVGSTRVEILGGKKTRWGRSSCWGEGRGGCRRQ